MIPRTDHLALNLDAFITEHRRCGKLDAGVKEDRVWLACEACGAQLVRAVLDEPPLWHRLLGRRVSQ
jgi:hypothetical protein